MNENYDVIVLGTGLTECILSGLLSVEGKKVLHMDRNDYYGGDCASLNLTQMFRKFRDGASPPEAFGRDRDYAIDLIPKFMMANGAFVRMLTHCEVTNYLEFKQIAGSYVFRDGKISKVPANEVEAVKSPLMGLFEKRRAKKFFEWVQTYDVKDPATWQGLDINKVTMAEVYKHFGLEPGTQDFIGHAMALHLDDSYINKTAKDSFDRIVMYTLSVLRYGKSPYVYPLYGLGELPQAFARRSALYGGTYMLHKPIEEVQYDAAGKVTGVKSEGECAFAPIVIGDPSYFPSKVRDTGKVIRSICLLKHPIPNTDDSDSVQIIIPQNQINRKSDIYIACVSSAHKVCAPGYYVAIVSTKIETSTPELELQTAYELLGPIAEKFVSIVDIQEPTADGAADGVYISKSYDATSHFETVCEDVFSIYKRVTGKELHLKSWEELQAQAEAQGQ
ncbi:GDP dissociation inhibitor [Catenaria anguillulae PL171]|uniref:Rab GDP dissociation inhibitor n=1 Tax=Catenaria anguillulae PL171 TaxID=765915 RepID=A0A1Y2H9I8_9FUNG|nr:GDP dissociation inhibitor [Catenaria anguillulae PL171]